MIERDVFSDAELRALCGAFGFCRERARFAQHGGRGNNKLSRARRLYVLALEELGREGAARLETRLDALAQAIHTAQLAAEMRQHLKRGRRNRARRLLA